MKNLFKVLSLAVVAAFVLASCQKEDVSVDESIVEKNSDYIVEIQKDYVRKKGPVPRKPGVVYILDQNWTPVLHKTLKVRNLSGTIVQEWLFVDMKSDIFYGYTAQAGDNSGEDHGFYYTWKPNFNTMSQSDWNQLVIDSDWGAETGFHIPRDNDIDNLATIIGGNEYIPTILNLEYDGASEWGPDYSSTFAAMWIDQPGNPNIVSGCGVYGMWKTSNNTYSNAYTNNPKLGVNVRLVRNISMTEWAE